MSTTQTSMRVIVGGISVPVTEVVVCPLTGQLLLRSAESATKFGVVDTALYVARELPKNDAGIHSRPATMVHPDVDPEILR